MTLPVRVGVALDPLADFDPARWRAQVDLMEELGVDSVWLPDAATLRGPAVLPALAAAAERTERLKLGIGVLSLPGRNPVLLARELATIDVLSGGRLLPAGGLGVAAAVERDALGVARGEAAPRLEEAVAIIKALWAGEPVTRAGRFWTLDGVRLTPRPVRRKLELWLGGSAPPMLRRIGRIADGWLASSAVAPEAFREACDVIRASARDAGRTIDEDHFGASVIAVAGEGERDRLGPLLARRAAQGTVPQVTVGTDALLERLQRFAAAGASKFVVTLIARDELAWLREVQRQVVEPLEREKAAR